MKKLLLLLTSYTIVVGSIAQTTQTFNFNGGTQNWVVPPCVTSINVVVAGAEGGGGQPGTANGGDGAVITATIPVTPGDVISMIVGGQGGCGNSSGGFNGGGSGWASSNGNANYNSCGGGGATELLINGTTYIIAAGGGGAGGGSVTYNNGGAGGCANGANGTSTYGQGGGGGSQASGGFYGAPWAGTPGTPAGFGGSLGQGGNGGMWQTASGGGGGGGYYGGGGGGNDGCCTGANGGGGGGGGSSLVPFGAGCTQGANTGNGYVSITYTPALPVGGTVSGPTLLCSGQVANLTLTGYTGNIQWQSAPTSAGPWTNVGGATNATYSPVVTGAICYRAELSYCGSTALSTVLCITTDNSPPIINCPGALTAICSVTEQPAYGNLAAFQAAGGTVSDPGGMIDAASFTLLSEVSDGNSCPETVTRTYQIADTCGLTSTCTQTITINDNIFPTASNPPTTVIPGGPVPAPNINVVTDEADNCGVPTVAFVSQISDGNSCPETVTYTYSVTDACGNSINVTHLVQITDPIPPTASNPASINVQCIGNVPAPDITVVTDEADNNGVPVVAFVSDVSDGNTCPETITRTYSVTDVCGNSINVTQLIIVDDTTPPTASNPPAINVECIGDVPTPDVTVVTDEADNCTAIPVVAFVSDVSDGNACPETITRTYSVTDDCGNSINVTQTIIVDDVTNPTASNPATINTTGSAPPPDPLVVIDEADNCTTNPVVAFVSDVSDGGLCPETITRTYSVTDDCGNSINVIQLIMIGDAVLPTASNPASIAVECIGDVPAPDPLVVTDEADNSGPPTVTWNNDLSDGNTCPETIIRTYDVTDVCANQIQVTQTITVMDITNPTASNPLPVVVECIGDVPAVDITVVTDEADNCTAIPTVAFVSDVSDGNTCPETITRTYSVTDDCGNSINVAQTITVNDITNPTASNPVAVNVQCSANVPAPDPSVVTDEADNCTVNPVVAFVSDVSDGNTCPEIITRTYSVTDDCGNTINVTQTLTIDDTTLPTASNPMPIVVQCSADVPVPDPSVVTDEADNCSVPAVAFVSDVSDGNSCPEVITRTYAVTDDCGNTINVTQTITVDDTTLPTASNPATINVACASDVPAPDINVVTDEADNCSALPIVAFVNDATSGSSCNNESITRTYSVTDDCGNQILVTQQINIAASNPTIGAGNDQEVCEGTAVTLVANNPDNAQISWDNGITNGTAFTQGVGTTTYTVTADICSGQCVSSDNVNVIVNPNPVVSFIADTLGGCVGLEVNFTNTTSIAGSNCLWTFGDGSTSSTCGNASTTYNSAGTFNVGLTVTTAEGCTDSDVYSNYITVQEFPVSTFSYSPGQVTVNDPEVQFTNSSYNASYYQWSFGDQSPTSSATDPTHAFPQIGDVDYTVTLIAYNSLGCTDTSDVIVTVEGELLFYVPNVFTPDGDNFNEMFQPIFTSGFDPYDFHLLIFNKWGEVVFESYNAAVGWTGTYGDQGLVEDGVYIWQIEFGDSSSDKRHKHRGHVTVLK